MVFLFVLFNIPIANVIFVLYKFGF